MKKVCAVALLIVFLVCSSSVMGQSTSSIAGTVVDKSGAVIAGAKVSLKNEATGAVQETRTTNAGNYSFASLPPGSYTIIVEMQGFQKWVSSKNIANVGEPAQVNATLQVGAVTSVVEVEASFEKLVTTNAEMSGVVEHKEIAQLPLNGRNPLNLIILEPGLVQRTTNATGSGTHVYGSRDRAHNVTIDGIDANESSVPNPQSNIYRLTPENVEEYRVTTLNATAELGRNSGANVSIATRAGGNSFHGDAVWTHRNTVLNSNEFYNNASGLTRPVLLLNQASGDIAGPIFKDKTFFFFSYQNNKIKQTQPISQSFGIPVVYTAAARAGNFRFVRGVITLGSQTFSTNSTGLVDGSGNLLPGVPVCGGVVTTNCVDSYNMFASDPAAIGANVDTQAMINSLPQPNSYTVGDGLNTAGFLWNTPSRFNGPFYMARIDQIFNPNNSLFARALWSTYDTTEGDLLNGRPSVYPGFKPLGEVFRDTQNVAVSYRRVLSQHLVNEFTTGYSRFNFFFSLNESNQVTGILAAIGQACFGTASFSNISTPYCNTPHTQRAVSNIQFIDNLSWIKGNHQFRVGINFRFYRHNDSRGVPGGFNMSPTIVFSRSLRDPRTVPTANPGTCGAGNPNCLFPTVTGGVGNGAGQIDTSDDNRLGQAIAEFMGIPARVQQVFQADLGADVYTKSLFTLGTREKQYDVYIQDEWKMGRSFTLTYGLRWEWNAPPTDCCNRTFVPDHAVQQWSPAIPVTFKKADSWFKRRNANALAPRLSFAWQPFKDAKTVLRGGVGFAFDTISTFQATAIGGKVPGATLQCNMNVQGTGPAACFGAADLLPDNQRLPAVFGAFNPFSMPIPTVLPSASFTPAVQPLGVAPSVGAFDPNLKIPTVYEWNLTVQRELPWGFTAEIGYIGKKGNRLFRAYDINQNKLPPEVLSSFLVAQGNVGAGCDPDGTVSGASVAACPTAVGVPTQLIALFGNAGLNSSTSVGELNLNNIGNMIARIDQQTGASAVPSRPNPLTPGVNFIPDYFRPNPQFSQIFYFDSGGSSIYHGGILSIRRRFERGLTMGFAYTYSKSMDDMSVDPVGATSGGALSTTNSRTPTDVRNFALDHARSDFDNRHVIVLNWLYELPFGQGRKWAASAPGWANQIIGGWTWTGIFVRQSGEPFTLNSGSFTVHNTHQSTAYVVGPLIQPSLQKALSATVKGPVVWNVGAKDLVQKNCINLLDPGGSKTTTLFCIPAPGQNGGGRNTVNGPAFWNLDVGILKNFTITERVKLQFRSEFFNIFNHANFENPRNASVGSPTVTSSAFGQTCCVSAAIASSATIIALGEPNRVIQFAFKITF
jgi:carboxypeptidase family protein/TonB-dependent receptor-like protein